MTITSFFRLKQTIMQYLQTMYHPQKTHNSGSITVPRAGLRYNWIGIDQTSKCAVICMYRNYSIQTDETGTNCSVILPPTLHVLCPIYLVNQFLKNTPVMVHTKQTPNPSKHILGLESSLPFSRYLNCRQTAKWRLHFTKHNLSIFSTYVTYLPV